MTKWSPMTNPVLLLKKRYHDTPVFLMDKTILIYLGVLGLLVLPFHNEVRLWGLYPIVHTIIILILMEFFRFSSGRSHPIVRFFRFFYPIIFVSLGFKELDNLFNMMFPFYGTDWAIKTDLALWGAHPTVWVQQCFTPWLTELMYFFYSVFWFYIPMVTFPLYFSERKQQAREAYFLILITYVACFLLFVLVPCEGAWIVLKSLYTVKPEGGFFLNLTNSVQAVGWVRGGALPSSHVAVAFTITWVAFKYLRRWGFLFLFLSIGIALATVYCGYHHAIDSIAGIAWGSLLFLIGQYILKKKSHAA